jgi:hypothetical protein
MDDALVPTRFCRQGLFSLCAFGAAVNGAELTREPHLVIVLCCTAACVKVA